MHCISAQVSSVGDLVHFEFVLPRCHCILLIAVLGLLLVLWFSCFYVVFGVNCFIDIDHEVAVKGKLIFIVI